MGTTFEDTLVGAGLLAGPANVVMQLARPGVGHGVAESRVESGRIFDHPVKRTRTTLTYLAVATLGSDEDRRVYRRAVNHAHAQVYSTEGSTVRYHAMDPDLQLWVAACLYRGYEDTYTAFHGPLDPDDLERVYRDAARLGTTLQVRESMWPATRAGFDRYWASSLAEVHIDDTVRAYLHSVVRLTYLPWPVAALLGGFSQFVTTGFLPDPFRREMGYRWTTRDQRRFERLLGVVRGGSRRLPRPLRLFPYNACLWDVRRRSRRGLALV